jgi:hypothetical protein
LDSIDLDSQLNETQKQEKRNRLGTVRDIGLHLTERMIDSWPITHENDNISFNSPLPISFPGEETSPYDEIVGNRDNLYASNEDGSGNDMLTYANGNPKAMPEVNYDSPGLALGQAKVINPDFQFNELDDVRTDYRRPYIGRLYSERIYDYNLPIVLFETGIMTLNLGLFSVASAFFGSETKDMAAYLRDPGGFKLKFAFQKIGAAIRGILNFTVGGLLSGKKFYKFERNTRVYMRFVNEMLIEVAAWMDLARTPVLDLESDWNTKDRTGETLEDAEKLEEQMDKEESGEGTASEFGEGNSKYSYPSAGYRGINRTISVLNILPGWKTSNNSVVEVKKSFWEPITDFFSDTANMTAAMFIPFGLSSGVNVSEQFSNQTMPHPLAADLKDKGRQVYQQSALGMLGGVSTGLNIANNLFNGDTIGAAFEVGKALFNSNAKKGKLGEAGMIMSGEGTFLLPDIWEGSNFQRSQTLSFRFYSPYGNRLPIYENTMIPTIFLIGMSAPRQVGTSTYTSPFYVRAFSKGLFSIEAGMIDSLTIKRSEEKNHRTVEGFSKVVSCELSIKDVLPALMIGLDAGVFGILSAKNTGFREYISMMANVDLYDRTAWINKYKALVAVLTNKLDPENLLNDFKYSISQTLPFKLYHASRTNFWNYRPPQTVSSIRAQSSYGM